MEKPRRLVRTPKPTDGIPTAVDIITRVAQYMEIVLASLKVLEHPSRALRYIPRAPEQLLRALEQTPIAREQPSKLRGPPKPRSRR